jgi:hypothetical protein
MLKISYSIKKMIFVLFLLLSFSNLYAGNELTLTVTGSSDDFGTISLNKGINYFNGLDLFTVSAKSGGSVARDLYVSMWYDGTKFWLVEKTDDGDDGDEGSGLKYIAFEASEDVPAGPLFTIPAKATAYVMNFVLPAEPPFLDQPVTIIAYLTEMGTETVVGMDSKTVLLNPTSDFTAPTE